jgi:hypothetical protein
MMQVLADDTPISYLDAPARDARSKARSRANVHQLVTRRCYAVNEQSAVWLMWTGAVEARTYGALLWSVGIDYRPLVRGREFVGFYCDSSEADLIAVLRRWSTSTPNLLRLAEHIQPKRRRKYDEYLSDKLLDEWIASQLCWVPPRDD